MRLNEILHELPSNMALNGEPDGIESQSKCQTVEKWQQELSKEVLGESGYSLRKLATHDGSGIFYQATVIHHRKKGSLWVEWWASPNLSVAP